MVTTNTASSPAPAFLSIRPERFTMAYSVGGEGNNFSVEFDGKKLPARQLVTDVRSWRRHS